MTEMTISELAAELGRRGGIVSKRGPGPLRRILMDVCEEIDSMENRQIFDYWQTYDFSAGADNAQLGTCWFKHGLWAYPLTSNDPGMAYHEPADEYRALPETWDEVIDGDYQYWYFDGKRDRRTNAQTIRQTMSRIKISNKRLSPTSA